MANQQQNTVGTQCAHFLDSLGAPGLIVFAWKKEDGSIEVIQSVKDLHPLEYAKAMSWAQQEILETL